jgi:hypothetical protein
MARALLVRGCPLPLSFGYLLSPQIEHINFWHEFA